MLSINHASREFPSTDRKCQWVSGREIVEGENHSERKRGSSDGKGNGMRKGQAGGWEAGGEAHGESVARSNGTCFSAVV